MSPPGASRDSHSSSEDLLALLGYPALRVMGPRFFGSPGSFQDFHCASEANPSIAQLYSSAGVILWYGKRSHFQAASPPGHFLSPVMRKPSRFAASADTGHFATKSCADTVKISPGFLLGHTPGASLPGCDVGRVGRFGAVSATPTVFTAATVAGVAGMSDPPRTLLPDAHWMSWVSVEDEAALKSVGFPGACGRSGRELQS